jgi:hypothetical protein
MNQQDLALEAPRHSRSYSLSLIFYFRYTQSASEGTQKIWSLLEQGVSLSKIVDVNRHCALRCVALIYSTRCGPRHVF